VLTVEVREVTVCYPEAEDRAALYALELAWAEWNPGVPLVRLDSERRSLGPPIAAYVHDVPPQSLARGSPC